MKHIKCVIVGDKDADKTCLLISFTTNAYPDQAVNLQLWDTAPQDDYAKLRPLSYPQTDIFIVCFSLVSPVAYERVKSTWIPEIKEHCPDTPFILVGTNSYFRDEFDENAEENRSQGLEPIPTSRGESLMKEIGACAYIECDARHQYHLKEVFDEAIEYVLYPPLPSLTSNEGGCCSIL